MFSINNGAEWKDASAAVAAADAVSAENKSIAAIKLLVSNQQSPKWNA